MLKWFFRIVFVIYILICLVAFFGQDRIILRPKPIPESERFRKGVEVEIPIDEDLSMNCLYMKESNPSKGVVIYFHGNKGNARRAIRQTRPIQDQGYDVFIPDYRGYGKTEGQLWSDKQLLADADKAYQYLKTKYAEKDIYVMGYSLGTGMASYVSSKNNPAHLFLVAPFTSLTAIKDKFAWFIPDFLLRYQLPVKKFLKDVNAAVTVVHGTNDNVVDYSFSEDLKRMYPKKINLITSKGQSHRGIIFDGKLVREIEKVLK